MADQFSFDVVSQVDFQEVKNAIEQTTKEVRQRFDFKGSKTELTLNEKEKQLTVVSDDEYKLNAVLDILKAKCVKRGVSVKALNSGKLEEALGGTVRQIIRFKAASRMTKPRRSAKNCGTPNSKYKGKSRETRSAY
jgi:Uncharacterized protein conserved in bacteria